MRFWIPLAFAAAACGSPQEVAHGDHAFVGVDVIPMASATPEVLHDQTVVVQGNAIVRIADRSALTVDGATHIIDGAGKVLIPGLSDMHVHYWLDEWDGMLFIANGVTRVRNMHGDPTHLTIKAAIDAGEIVGPELRTTGPALDGNPPFQPTMVALETPEAATAEVAREAAAGYEMIKVYSGLKPEVYAAVVQEAATLHMKVVGHVPDAIGVIAAATQQISAEHLLLFDLNGQHLPQVSAVVQAGQWTCPTLVAMDRLRRLDALRASGIEGEEYVAPLLRTSWQSTLSQFDVPKVALNRVLHDIASAGGRILVGTDANVPFLVPGWALHDELALMVEAGLSPYDVLRAATYNAAAFFDELGQSGTVAPGRVADLVLLDSNPIDDITATRQRAGVMVKGRWYPSDAVAGLLEQVKAGRTQ